VRAEGQDKPPGQHIMTDSEKTPDKVSADPPSIFSRVLVGVFATSAIGVYSLL
jgi:hypothetical protein